MLPDTPGPQGLLAFEAGREYLRPMGSGERLPAKKDVMLALLENADVFIHLDPRRDNVRVPQWFKKQPHLVLQIGLNMPVAITDLEVCEDSVSCTLSFNRSPFFCWIPWSAVYALVGSDNRAMVWPEDIPPEVAAQAAKAAAVAEQKAQKRGHLRAVGEGAEEAAEAEAQPSASPAPAESEVAPEAPAPIAAVQEAESQSPSEPPAKAKRQLPSYLRVVK